MAPLFHLSIPVNDLDRAKDFYLSTLGCEIGRETKGRFDINFFGHHVEEKYLLEKKILKK